MPIRKATQSIVLSRKGARIEVAPDQEFDFTADEIADIEAVSPDILSSTGTVDLAAADVPTKGKKAAAAAASNDL